MVITARNVRLTRWYLHEVYKCLITMSVLFSSRTCRSDEPSWVCLHVCRSAGGRLAKVAELAPSFLCRSVDLYQFSCLPFFLRDQWAGWGLSSHGEGRGIEGEQKHFGPLRTRVKTGTPSLLPYCIGQIKSEGRAQRPCHSFSEKNSKVTGQKALIKGRWKF